MLRFVAWISALAFATVCGAQDRPPLLLRHPTLSATQIVFEYAGDLWSVSREGGVARRLTSTSGNGAASLPCFSPDGGQIAYSADYGGNVDVYTVPATGGSPRRLTYHPDEDYVIGWTPDGKQVLFASSRSDYRYSKLFTVSAEGGPATELPLPMAAEGSYSPDGSQLAYVPLNHAFEIWKRYRGGRTSPLWIANLSDSSVTRIPRNNSNDFNPMWIGDRIFFLSDRNGPMSLLSYNTRSKVVTVALKNGGLDFKYASAAKDAIVIEQFGAILLYDLKSGLGHKVDIQIAEELPETRPRYVNVADRINNADISPTGAKAVFEARGEILSISAEKDDARNITNTTGADERYPAWSPDGTRIAYFSDESGEYQLYVKNEDGTGEPEKINLGTPPSYFLFPTWSPDGNKIAYVDKRLNLWYVDLKKKTPVRIFHDRFTGPQQILQASWSPDSRWLAYTQQEVNHMRAIFLYSLETGRSERVTDGMSDAFSPVFDQGGNYLYVLASTNVGPRLDVSMVSIERPVITSVYIVLLRRDLPSPITVENDEKNRTEHLSATSTAAKLKGAEIEGTERGTKTTPATVSVDFEKIAERILALPIPSKNYSTIIAGKEGTIFLLERPQVEPEAVPFPTALTAHRFELKTRTTDKLVEGILSLHVSANGEKLLYRQADAPQQTWLIASVPEVGKGISEAETLNLKSMEVHTEPKTEWREMYHEGFRFVRDFFYDPDFHGLDLNATEKKYAVYLPGLGSRKDLSYIFQDAMGELTVSHIFRFGEETSDAKAIPVGLLGADYNVENGRYRFSQVYDGGSWNPELFAPLTQPGVNVAEGEYLLAVNGREVRGTDNIYSFFENTPGKSVHLQVGPSPDGRASREVTVVPIEDEGDLRQLAWVEANRRKVDQLSHGRLAYIYLPDTDSPGYKFFNRYFFAQAGKEGAVVDMRFNGGGSPPDYPLLFLQQTLMNYRTARDGEDMTSPMSFIPGPKAMIINEFTLSGGEALAWYFRQSKAGILVGKRTWGGVTGFWGPTNTYLMDGTWMPVPSRGLWTPNDKWELENQGVKPDVDIDLDPKIVREGHDPQLERAVEILLEELRKNPIPVHKKPPYPNYHNPGTNVPAYPDH
jgi:tricorn protease